MITLLDSFVIAYEVVLLEHVTTGTSTVLIIALVEYIMHCYHMFSLCVLCEYNKTSHLHKSYLL